MLLQIILIILKKQLSMLVETETNPPHFKKDAERILNLSPSDVDKLIKKKRLKVINIGGKNYISNYSIKSLQIEFDEKKKEIIKNDVQNAISKFIEEKIIKFSKVINVKQREEKKDKRILELSTYENITIDIQHKMSENSIEIFHQNKLITFGEMREVVRKVYQNRIKRRTF